MGMKSLAKMVKDEQVKESVKPSERFTNAFKDFVVSFSKGNSRPSSKSINPSSFYKCYRQLWYKLNDFPANEKTSFRGEVRLQHGTSVHEMFQDIYLTQMNGQGIELLKAEDLSVFSKEGVEFVHEHSSSPIEVKFRDTRYTKVFPISAMVDGALEFEGLRYVFEFKTINTKDFSTLFEPLREHVIQGGVYALSLEIPRVMFMYFDKDKDDIKVFIVEYTEEQLSWVKSRLSSMDVYCSSPDLPPKEVGDSCKYCSYSRLCKSDISTK